MYASVGLPPITTLTLLPSTTIPRGLAGDHTRLGTERPAMTKADMATMAMVENGLKGQGLLRTGLVHSEKSPSHCPDHGTVRF
ncbi:protein of unknown function [Magnetospirillum gryphiswaldense MSR-1 v2]|uniref:Uncharacterized protein n=1 Tax=Magnetospirillum gryphiswaldense (strain DSM 6361 / JCM 21280 / NBRC 15271 / MSR-1) TaxID=431944 RepID=V6EVK8_MAGGM|nr:protein of unknown function [Magnetospirillum gryphiswaldense MSR-1 v2]